MNEPSGTVLDLPGLEPDNLLAFLAVLGALRALEAAQPAWQPRASWDGPPWQARLHIANPVTQEDVTAAALEGMRRLAATYEFGGKADINWTVGEFRAYAKQLRTSGEQERLRLLGALASDGFAKKGGAGKDETVAATALCAVFGAGHQHFLGQLAQLRGLAQQEAASRDVADALFAPWQYVQRKDALKFRWDPAEDRRYAYRASNPSDEAVGVAPGANLLATLGFPLFLTAPRHDELGTVAFGRQKRERFVTWPIWEVPLSLASMRALLALPALLRDPVEREAVEPYGVTEVMRATRLQNDKYFNFSRARPMWGSRASRAPVGAARAAG